ncbi:MAG: hypothetical protein G8345_13375 [Magnetococcales bacterium]|nr:hypothetical protein [Magnetococcales bacterium]NGZ27865.1 hypothetical protein [Magnetococcales bacterium]
MFFIIPILDWFDYIILVFSFLIIPMIILLVWLLGIPCWILWKAFSGLFKRQWIESLQYSLVIPFAFIAAKAGSLCAGVIAILFYGNKLMNEVEAVKGGSPPKNSNGIFSSSTMAYKITGGWLDITRGIAYDTSGQLGALLKLPPSERPPEWQKNAVDVIKCQGSARHLGGHFYQIVVSTYSC